MGFRSGNWAAYDKVLIWWPFIYTLIDLAELHSAGGKKQFSELEPLLEQKAASFLPD